MITRLPKKWEILENILVEKLVFWWKWFARLKSDNPEIDWRVIFITWWAIPWSIVNLRVIKRKSWFIDTQIVDIIKKSPIEKKHQNNPYWECWWCKWVNIDYKEQLKIKQNQVKESFFHLEKYQNNLDEIFEEITPCVLIDWYRNKIEFSFWKYISKKTSREEHFNVWFHKQWEFSKIEDYDGCILIDEFQNEIFRKIKKFAKNTGYPVYDTMTQKGFFRHLILRKTYFTDELMIILWFNPAFFDDKQELFSAKEKLKEFFLDLLKQYPQIKSIYFSLNDNKADIAIWELELIYWEKFIREKLLDLNFNISPKSFFQTNSVQAEILYKKVIEFAWDNWDLKNQIVLDLYWWTWTIWMIFAKFWAKEVISVEMVESASKDWEKNAKLNNLENIKFENAKTEDFLKKYLSQKNKADLLIVDPPRSGMHPSALEDILKFDSKKIIYVSCNPSTLARDLENILKNSDYRIKKIWIVDMFPHTHHIETIVSLEKE